jgi:multidrug efflux pump subunit AcrA (membrane-fusion protein)
VAIRTILRNPGWAAAFLVIATVGCGGSGASEAVAPAEKPVKARVVAVTQRQVRRNVEAVGTLFPMDEVTVGSEVDGRVAKVLVDVGDQVALGRPLVEIAPAELTLTAEQQAAALDQVRAQLGLPEGSADLTNVDDAAEVRRAAADRDDAAQKFARARSLFEDGLVARGDYDTAEARAKTTEAAWQIARQNVENLRAQVAQRSASLAFARKKLADTVIRAPFAGQVKQRLVTSGQYVKVQTPVMVIVDTDPLRVRLQVPEKLAGDVAVGQAVSVRVDAHPDRTFEGKVSRINPSVDPLTRSFEVEALLDNKEGALKPGFFAKAAIASNRVDTELLVPGDALRYRYGVYKVFTVDASRLKEKDVKLGERRGNDVAIADGLAAGDSVAVPLEGEDPREGAPVEAAR